MSLAYFPAVCRFSVQTHFLVQLQFNSGLSGFIISIWQPRSQSAICKFFHVHKAWFKFYEEISGKHVTHPSGVVFVTHYRKSNWPVHFVMHMLFLCICLILCMFTVLICYCSSSAHLILFSFYFIDLTLGHMSMVNYLWFLFRAVCLWWYQLFSFWQLTANMHPVLSAPSQIAA